MQKHIQNTYTYIHILNVDFHFSTSFYVLLAMCEAIYLIFDKYLSQTSLSNIHMRTEIQVKQLEWVTSSTLIHNEF